jgi:hypothetical protein
LAKTLVLPELPDYVLRQGDAARRGLSRTMLAVLVAVLLLIAASRITRLYTLDMQKDEVWSVWITLGSLEQTIAWTGYDWPPGHFILIYFWRTLTGISPFALRMSTVFTALIGASLLFAVGRRLFGARAGVVAVLAFSGFGFSVILSTMLRGYMLVLTLFLLSLWCALRYFERPSYRRALWVGLAMSAMFYIHTTAVFGMGAIALISLILYRGVWRWFRLWVLPGLIVAAVCAPFLIYKLDVVQVKNDIWTRFVPYVAPELRLSNLYLDFFGLQAVLWIALAAVSAAMFLERWRLQRRTVMLLVWLLIPIPLLPLITTLDAFNVRHLAWVMVGLALWIGWGVALLPRAALAAIALAMALVSFDRMPLRERYESQVPRLPFVTSFNTLQHELRNGDVLLTDLICAGCVPIDAEEWDYFVRAYFPNGLTFITPAQAAQPRHQRVWYVATKGKETPDTLKMLESSRALSRTFGEESFLFRLYEAPPDPSAAGVLFDNGMRLRGAELLNDADLSLVWREGDTVRLRLWWSADRPIDLDYSEAAFFWDRAVGVTAQTDGPPQLLNGLKETSRWVVGALYLEERTLKLPYPLKTGEYDIMLSVYQWWDAKRIAAPGVTQDTLLPIGTIYVKAW